MDNVEDNYFEPFNFKWTLSRMQLFIKALMDVALCSGIEELKDHIYPDYVWMEAETKLNLDYRLLKVTWYHRLHMQLFCSEPLYIMNVKINIIEYLHKKVVANNKKKKIRLDRIVARMDGTTIPFLHSVYSDLIYLAEYKTGSKELKDQVTWLYEHYIPYLCDNPDNQVLPRLDYNNGRLMQIDKDLVANNNNNNTIQKNLNL